MTCPSLFFCAILFENVKVAIPLVGSIYKIFVCFYFVFYAIWKIIKEVYACHWLQMCKINVDLAGFVLKNTLNLAKS